MCISFAHVLAPMFHESYYMGWSIGGLSADTQSKFPCIERNHPARCELVSIFVEFTTVHKMSEPPAFRCLEAGTMRFLDYPAASEESNRRGTEGF